MKKVFIILLALVFLVPVASGNAEILFQDDFDDGDYAGWTHIDATVPDAWTVTPEGYLQRSLSGAAQYLQLDAPTLPESYVLEFDTRTLDDGGGLSLIAWYTHFTDWCNQLAHGYNVGRTYINETLGCSWELNEYFNAPTEIAIDEWHHIKYVKDGTSVSLYFDDELIYSVTIPVPITGGHLVLAGCPGTHQFDNVVITTLPDSLEERVEELENRVEELEAALDALSNHTHTYMTGKGKGHNDTEAPTSTPIVPEE
jgi:hypothetical protein